MEACSSLRAGWRCDAASASFRSGLRMIEAKRMLYQRYPADRMQAATA